MKFDTSGWGEFKLSDLFEISGSTTTPKQELEKYGNGEYPYITTQAIYNGIAGYYNKWTEQGQCLTIDSAVLGTCFYQSKNFSASDHVEILRPKFTINREIGLFLSIIINRMGNILGYAYTKKRSQTALKKEKISLPTDKDGKPDWEFMENTIKSTQNKMTKIIKAYELVKNGGGGGNSLNSLACPAYSQLDSQTHHFLQEALMQIAVELMNDLPCKWKEFQLVDLFELHLAKGDLQPKKLQNGEIPLVSAGGANNGIVMYIKDGDGKSDKFDSNVITIDMFGKAFYQNKDFFAVSHGRVNILKPKFKLNFHIGLFFVSLFDKKLLDNFSFTKMCSQGRLQKETINLPIDSNGEPNFALMEKFIKNIEQEHSAKLLKFYEVLKANGGGGTFNLNAYKQYLSSNPNLTPLSTLQWREFKIGELFNNIRQGARLKQADHIKGNLPFVMAGTENTGISGFIGNENARKFKANALTIDIFGNVFYRAYEFGASDDVGVFWNENNSVKEKSMLFLSAVIYKALQGKFDFGHKLRASQSYDIKILLPVNKNGQIAFEFMETFIKAVEKEVIKSVVLWSEKRLNATKQVISKPL